MQPLKVGHVLFFFLHFGPKGDVFVLILVQGKSQCYNTIQYNTIQYNTIQYNFIICKQKFDFTSQGIDIYKTENKNKYKAKTCTQ